MRQPAALRRLAQFVCAGNSYTISETIQPCRSIRQKPGSFSGSLSRWTMITTSLRGRTRNTWASHRPYLRST